MVSPFVSHAQIVQTTATSTHVSPKPVDSLVAKPGIIDATQLLGGRERRQRIGQLDGVFAAECAVNTSWFG